MKLVTFMRKFYQMSSKCVLLTATLYKICLNPILLGLQAQNKNANGTCGVFQRLSSAFCATPGGQEGQNDDFPFASRLGLQSHFLLHSTALSRELFGFSNYFHSNGFVFFGGVNAYCKNKN